VNRYANRNTPLLPGQAAAHRCACPGQWQGERQGCMHAAPRLVCCPCAMHA
jgi:hypothetical protein